MAQSRFRFARMHKSIRRASGDLTLNSTSWANVDTGLDLTLAECQEGDVIVYGISGVVGNEAPELFLDVCTLVSGTPTNSFAVRGPVETSPSPGFRIGAWRAAGGGYVEVGGEAPPYTVASGDLVGGAVTFRLRYATATAANRTLFANSTTKVPLDVWVRNLGPAQA